MVRSELEVLQEFFFPGQIPDGISFWTLRTMKFLLQTMYFFIISSCLCDEPTEGRTSVICTVAKSIDGAAQADCPREP